MLLAYVFLDYRIDERQEEAIRSAQCSRTG